MMPKKSKISTTDDHFDDGRTIVKMDVEGMPWVRKPRLSGGAKASKPIASSGGPPPTKQEMRMLLKSAVLASLAICGIFILVCVLFIATLLLLWGQKIF